MEIFFGQPVENYLKPYDNIQKITTGQRDDFITGSLLDYNYLKKTLKIIAIDLKKQQALDANQYSETTGIRGCISNRRGRSKD